MSLTISIEVAQNGAVAVRRTIEGMDRIVSSTREASDVIVGLGNRIELIKVWFVASLLQ